MSVIADTGPLYALIDASDAWHERVITWWKANRQPVIVPVTVLPEVSYLLQSRISHEAELAFIRAVADGEFTVEPWEDGDIDRAAGVMERYADASLGFVDATVAAIAERLDARDVLTTDRRHFGVIRPRHARGFHLLP